MRRFFHSLLLGLSLVATHAASAVDVTTHHPLALRISSENGLSQNVVTAQAEDHEGRLWVGTQDGLNLLSNNDYQVFRSDQKERHLAGSVISDIAIAADGGIWVATDKGIDRIDAHTLQTTHLDLGATPYAAVTRLGFADSRTLVYLSDGRLYQHTLNSGQTNPLPINSALDRIYAFHPYDERRLAVLSRNGIVLFERGTGKSSVFPLNLGGLDEGALVIKSFAIDTQGRVIVSLRGAGLFRCTPDATPCREYSTRNGGLDSDNIAEIHVVGAELYLGTDSGIERLNPDSGARIHLIPDTKDREYRSAQIVRNLTLSQSGDLFLGTFNGLYRIPAHYAALTALHVGDGRFVNSLTGVVATTEQGEPVLAVAGPDALTLWSVDDDQPRERRRYPYPEGFEPVTLTRDGDELYFGTLGSGNFRLDREHGLYLPLADRFPGLGQDQLTQVQSPAPDIRLLVTESQLLVYRRDGTAWHPLWSKPFVPSGLAAVAYWQGRIYAAAYSAGLYSAAVDPQWHEPGNWLQHQGLGIAINLHRQDRGPEPLRRLQVLTADSGLYQVVPDNDGPPAIIRLPVSDRLNSQTLVCAVNDEAGRLLLATHRGIAILAPDGELQTSLTTLQGLHQQEFAQYQCGSLGRRYFFAGEEGLTLLDDTALPAGHPPAVRWLNADADGQMHTLNNDGTLRLTAPGLLRLNYVATPSQLPKQASFSYRILPLSRQWTDAPSSTLTLTNLRPGHYDLELVARDFAGRRSAPARISLDIAPPFLESPLAIAGYVALALIVIYTLVANKFRADRAELKLQREQNRQQQRYTEILEAEVVARTQELEERKEEAIRANQDKTRFIAAASHDLKHPLNLIRLQLEQARGQGGGASELAAHIGASTEFLDTLVNSIVELSKLDANIIVPNPATLALDTLLQRLSQDYRAFAGQYGVELELNMEPELCVRCDEHLLQRILHNILDNAIKISDAGQRVEIHARHREGGVELSIRDHGPGMPVALRAQAFQPFTRGTTRYQGSGLGLSVVKGMSALLGIEIAIEDAPPTGTRFTLRFAAAAPEAAAPADSAATRHLALIDDDAQQRETLAAQLRERGFSVSQFANAESFERDALPSYDAIISDIDLGTERDGLAYIDTYRARLGEHPAIIYISGNRNYRERVPEGDSVYFLPKPLKTGKLIWLLHQGLAS